MNNVWERGNPQFTSKEVMEAIEKANLIKPEIDKHELLDHMYLGIDGNTRSRTNKLAIATNSVPLKQESGLFEFFEMLPSYKENKVFLPIKGYVDDLVATLNKTSTHQNAMKNIAEYGEQFGKKYLSRAAVLSYANSRIDVTRKRMICATE